MLLIYKVNCKEYDDGLNNVFREEVNRSHLSVQLDLFINTFRDVNPIVMFGIC